VRLAAPFFMILIATTFYLVAALISLYFAINSISLIKNRTLVFTLSAIESIFVVMVIVYSALNQVYFLTVLFGILIIPVIPFLLSKQSRDHMFIEAESMDINYEIFGFFYYALLGSLIYFFLLVQ
tara:strand:+ start:569 stop:943 length:375 start_codon:yes stop_codon:yes gene_type:complete